MLTSSCVGGSGTGSMSPPSPSAASAALSSCTLAMAWRGHAGDETCWVNQMGHARPMGATPRGNNYLSMQQLELLYCAGLVQRLHAGSCSTAMKTACHCVQQAPAGSQPTLDCSTQEGLRAGMPRTAHPRTGGAQCGHESSAPQHRPQSAAWRLAPVPALPPSGAHSAACHPCSGGGAGCEWLCKVGQHPWHACTRAGQLTSVSHTFSASSQQRCDNTHLAHALCWLRAHPPAEGVSS